MDSGSWMEDRALSYDSDEEEVGIPNVEAIVWAEELKRVRAALDAGRCPKHGIPLELTDQEEYCPACQQDRDEP